MFIEVSLFGFYEFFWFSIMIPNQTEKTLKTRLDETLNQAILVTTEIISNYIKKIIDEIQL